jgi:hypothetical protein
MRILCYIVVSLALAYAGCSSSDITSPNDIVFPATHVSFKAQVEPLFSISCNIAGCHSFDSQAGGVDLTSWYGARNPIVVNNPGDTTCNLILVIYGRVFHNGPININANNRQGLKQWVIEGAQNN